MARSFTRYYNSRGSSRLKFLYSSTSRDNITEIRDLMRCLPRSSNPRFLKESELLASGEKIKGIYVILKKETNIIFIDNPYIGNSTNVKNRRNQHLGSIKKGKHTVGKKINPEGKKIDPEKTIEVFCFELDPNINSTQLRYYEQCIMNKAKERGYTLMNERRAMTVKNFNNYQENPRVTPPSSSSMHSCASFFVAETACTDWESIRVQRDRWNSFITECNPERNLERNLPYTEYDSFKPLV